MKERIRKLLFLDLGKKELFSVRDEIMEENRRCLVLYSAIVFGGMTGLLVLSFFVPVLESSRKAYEAAALVGVALLFAAAGPGKKNGMLVVLGQFLLIFMLLAFGIILGTVVEPDEASASFAVLLFVTPLLFTDLPYRLNIVSVISIVIYIIAAKKTQSAQMFAFNLSVILPYGIANLVLTHFTSRMKIERSIYAHEKKVMGEYDRMTELLNRWSFERDVEEIKREKGGELFSVGSLDLNNLKTANDRYGHKAGDGLLLAAAKVITEVFGGCGKCYRIGGDEFMVLAEGKLPEEAEIGHRLEEAEKACDQLKVPLSISWGLAFGEGKDVEALILEADRKMYLCKDEYYRKTQIERRSQH